jgi:hypothetical protein
MPGRTVEIDGFAGTWLIPSWLEPSSAGMAPAALIIAGSGPTDRDGNNAFGLKTDAYRQLAEALAAAGIASLRYDKRGIGGSRALAGREEELTFETFIADAVRLADWVSRQPLSARIVLIGHSEGALIAALAATRVAVAGVVYLAGPGVALGETLRQQLSASPMPTALREAAMAALDEMDRDGRVTAPPRELLSVFRPSVQPFLASLWRIDPREAIATLLTKSVPVLQAAGGQDAQIREADSRRLGALESQGLKLAWFPTMAHILKDATGRSNAALYGDPALPLMPGLGEAIARFIHATG